MVASSNINGQNLVDVTIQPVPHTVADRALTFALRAEVRDTPLGTLVITDKGELLNFRAFSEGIVAVPYPNEYTDRWCVGFLDRGERVIVLRGHDTEAAARADLKGIGERLGFASG